ncbi:hypothetical protein LINPERPRIM_LOCUS27912 [Linum perenne]
MLCILKMISRAISSKESQLSGNLGSYIDVDSEEDCSGPVRVVSPKAEESTDSVDWDSNPGYSNPGISNEDHANNGVSGMSSYYECLDQTKIQFSKSSLISNSSLRY